MQNGLRGALAGRLLFASLILAGGLSALGGGCATPIDYRPNLQMVDELGLPETKLRLSETLTRAIAPRVAGVQVTEDSLRYRWRQTVHGAYGIPIGSVPQEVQIFYANVSRVEVFSNHYVYVWGPGNRTVDQVLFANGEDARAFADLVCSLRERRLGGDSQR